MAALEHCTCVVVHEGFGGDVEVAKLDVQFPLPDDVDYVTVDTVKEHCHCAIGAEEGR